MAESKKITLTWLFANVPFKSWMYLIGLVVAAFSSGVTLGNTTLMRELLGVEAVTDPKAVARLETKLARTELEASEASAVRQQLEEQVEELLKNRATVNSETVVNLRASLARAEHDAEQARAGQQRAQERVDELLAEVSRFDVGALSATRADLARAESEAALARKERERLEQRIGELTADATAYSKFVELINARTGEAIRQINNMADSPLGIEKVVPHLCSRAIDFAVPINDDGYPAGAARIYRHTLSVVAIKLRARAKYGQLRELLYEELERIAPLETTPEAEVMELRQLVDKFGNEELWTRLEYIKDEKDD